MAAQYLLRLNDACPTMRREAWDPLERAIDKLGIKPIDGVVPDNKDPKLACADSDNGFWERVRGWKRRGWSIAMHGLHHVYHPVPRGASALLPTRRKSEFVGISLEQQKAMVRRAAEILARQQIVPELFIAPGHSFDTHTLS